MQFFGILESIAKKSVQATAEGAGRWVTAAPARILPQPALAHPVTLSPGYPSRLPPSFSPFAGSGDRACGTCACSIDMWECRAALARNFASELLPVFEGIGLVAALVALVEWFRRIIG